MVAERTMEGNGKGREFPPALKNITSLYKA
jgi:hypothetical protein